MCGNAIIIWNWHSQIKKILNIHSNEVQCIKFSPNGQYILSCDLNSFCITQLDSFTFGSYQKYTTKKSKFLNFEVNNHPWGIAVVNQILDNTSYISYWSALGSLSLTQELDPFVLKEDIETNANIFISAGGSYTYIVYPKRIYILKNRNKYKEIEITHFTCVLKTDEFVNVKGCSSQLKILVTNTIKSENISVSYGGNNS